jgi:hypothetical protein
MPSATPIPRGPAHLALFGAEDLLVPGACPVCRYVAEADDRFLGWFALEGHAEAETITRLCASLGTCPAHTRALLGQPGADGRLTAVYRYVLRAAVCHLADGTSPKAPCPGCSGSAEAASRAIGTMVAGLQEDESFRERYRAAGGLCVPHLRLAAGHGPRRPVAWLAADAQARLAAGPPPLTAIAGESDADAGIRTWLRAALPASAPTVRPAGAMPGREPGADGGCAICLAAARAERDALAQLSDATADDSAAEPSWAGLCPAHLREACTDVTGDSRPGWPHRPGGLGPADGSVRLLALQAELCRAWLAGISPAPGLRSASGLRSAVSRRARRRVGSWRASGQQRDAGCPACGAWRAAANSASGRLLRVLASSSAARRQAAEATWAPRLCLRHVLSLRQAGPRAAEPAVRAAARTAELLVGELEEAFRKRTWAHREEGRGPEMTAWRRAAALIDGRVYGGGPPRALRA